MFNQFSSGYGYDVFVVVARRRLHVSYWGWLLRRAYWVKVSRARFV